MLKRRYKQPTKLVFLTFMHSSSGGNRCGFSSIFNTRMESILLFPHCFRQQAMKACFLPQASITQVLILPGPESPLSPTLPRKQQVCMPIKRRREHAEYFAMQTLQYLASVHGPNTRSPLQQRYCFPAFVGRGTVFHVICPHFTHLELILQTKSTMCQTWSELCSSKHLSDILIPTHRWVLDRFCSDFHDSFFLYIV